MNQWMKEIADIAAARMAKQKAAQAANVPAEKAPPKSAYQLRQELAAALADFDPAYEQSDDHAVWKAGQAKANRIAALRMQIERLRCGDQPALAVYMPPEAEIDRVMNATGMQRMQAMLTQNVY